MYLQVVRFTCERLHRHRVLEEGEQHAEQGRSAEDGRHEPELHVLLVGVVRAVDEAHLRADGHLRTRDREAAAELPRVTGEAHVEDAALVFRKRTHVGAAVLLELLLLRDARDVLRETVEPCVLEAALESIKNRGRLVPVARD